MANALQQKMANDIASLVRKQTFAGSGVWRQSGNATLRIETQTDSLLGALSRIPSRETQEEEERESDRQHEELINAIKGISFGVTGTSTPEKKGGLLGAVGAGAAMGTASIVKSTSSLLTKLNPFKKGGVISKIFTGLVAGVAGISTLIPKGLLGAIKFLFKGLRFLGLGAVGLVIADFLLASEDEQKKKIDGFFNIVNKVGNFFETIGKQFSTEFMKTFEEVGGNEELDRLGKAFNNFTDVLGVQATGLVNYVKNIKISFNGVNYTGDDLVKFFAEVSAKTSKNLISFAAATLEYLADPELAIKDLKEVVSNSLKEFGFLFSELFSKATLVRMAESYGLGALIPDSFREDAASGQILRSMEAGRGMIRPENTVANVATADDFGSFSALNLLKNLNQGVANYTMRLYDDAGRIIEITNDTLKNAILGPEVLGEYQSGGKVSQTGLYKLHAGEIVFDPPSSSKIDNFVASYLPQSGATINGLQMDRTMGGLAGSTAPVVIDNSQQPTIINQTNVAAPQTRGPALVGEGRDKVNMR